MKKYRFLKSKILPYLVLFAAWTLSACAALDFDNMTNNIQSVANRDNSPVNTESVPNYDPSGGEWQLVWSDEFSGTSLDSSKWSYDIGNSGNGNAGWGNNELEYYTDRPENVKVQDGNLVITALKDGYNGYSYSSGRIYTKAKYEFQYGKIAARIKVPTGQGVWPAFWMLGVSFANTANNWPRCGEIDIMENVGGTDFETGRVVGNAFWYDENTSATANQVADIRLQEREKLGDNYHIFEAEWDAASIKIKMDGNTFNTVNTTPAVMEEFRKSFFILLNLAVGGNWPGTPDPNVYPQQMLVDWVKVYQKNVANPVDVPVVSGCLYRLTNSSGLVLSGGAADSDMGVYQNPKVSQKTQFWKMEDVGGGYYKLTLEKNKMCLGVSNALTTSGAFVIQQSYAGLDSQKWKVEKMANGSFRLAAKHSGLCLSIQGNSVSGGVPAVQSADNNQPGQRWLTAFVAETEVHSVTLDIFYPVDSSTVYGQYPVWGTASAYNNLEGVYVSVDNGPVVKAQGTTNWFNMVNFTPGNHVVSVYAKDANGLTSDTRVILVTGAAAAPVMTILDSFVNGTVTGVTPVNYIPGVEVVGRWGSYARPGWGIPQSPINSDGTWSCQCNHAGEYPGDGCHLVQAYLYPAGKLFDIAMRVSAAYTHFYRNDTQTPALTVQTPPNTVGNRFTLSGTAQDDTELGGVYVSVDNSVFNLVPGTDSGTSATWSTNLALSDGTHTIKVYTKDWANHQTGTQTFTVNADTVPPVLTVQTLPTVVFNPALSISGTVRDDVNNAGVYLSLNASSFNLVPGSANGTSSPVNWQTNLTLPKGLCTIQVYALDAYGNSTLTNAYFITNYPFIAEFGCFGGSQVLSTDYWGTVNVYKQQLADVNNDGKPDLVLTYGSDDGNWCSIYVCLGNGNGTFNAPLDQQFFTTYTYCGVGKYIFDVQDVNGDGKPDLVWTHSGPTGLIVYTALGNGNGTFAQPTGQKLRSDNWGAVNVYKRDFADVNNDGKQDLVCSLSYSSGASAVGYVCLGNGNGTFASPVQNWYSTSSFTAEGVYNFNLADVNNDGKLDMVWTRSGPTGLFVYVMLGNGNGTCGQASGQQLSSVNWGNVNEYKQQLADVNNDGKQDLVLWQSYESGSLAMVYVCLGNGNGTFGSPIDSQYRTTAFGAGEYSMKLADMNGDGKLDAIFMRSGPTGLYEYFMPGNGNGTFAQASPLMIAGANSIAAGGNYIPHVANVDSRGSLPDLVWTHSGPDGLWIYTVCSLY